eukprot:scaffold122422_cov63-Phaeocystis_antarctica.AAC.4
MEMKASASTPTGSPSYRSASSSAVLQPRISSMHEKIERTSSSKRNLLEPPSSHSSSHRTT